jgi:hypothetical protein
MLKKRVAGRTGNVWTPGGRRGVRLPGVARRRNQDTAPVRLELPAPRPVPSSTPPCSTGRLSPDMRIAHASSAKTVLQMMQDMHDLLPLP